MNTTNSQISSLYRTARNNAALAGGSLLSAVPPGQGEDLFFQRAQTAQAMRFIFPKQGKLVTKAASGIVPG